MREKCRGGGDVWYLTPSLAKGLTFTRALSFAPTRHGVNEIWNVWWAKDGGVAVRTLTGE